MAHLLAGRNACRDLQACRSEEAERDDVTHHGSAAAEGHEVVPAVQGQAARARENPKPRQRAWLADRGGETTWLEDALLCSGPPNANG